MYTRLKVSDEEYLRKISIVAKYPLNTNLIQEMVDKSSHRIKNKAALEWLLTSKLASAIESGLVNKRNVSRWLNKFLSAELNRESRNLARHDILPFSSMAKTYVDNGIDEFEVVDERTIEKDYIRNETINLVFNFASNVMERAMVSGMMDGLTDAEIGRRISEMDDNKYTLQAYRKAVRKFRLRCADALSTEV